MNNKEIWKNVVGYEGLYEVSNFGNVRSKDMILPYERHCVKGKRIRRGIMLTKIKMKNGYLRVMLSHNGGHKLEMIHRLVATAFIPNPNNLPQVNHVDCNKENNNVNNLEWCTCKENMIHAQKNNLYKNHKIILQIKDGIVIREFRSACDVKRELGYSSQAIGKVALGKRKSAYGFQWAFKKRGK